MAMVNIRSQSQPLLLVINFIFLFVNLLGYCKAFELAKPRFLNLLRFSVC